MIPRITPAPTATIRVSSKRRPKKTRVLAAHYEEGRVTDPRSVESGSSIPLPRPVENTISQTTVHQSTMVKHEIPTPSKLVTSKIPSDGDRLCSARCSDSIFGYSFDKTTITDGGRDNSETGLPNILVGPDLMTVCHRSTIPQCDECTSIVEDPRNTGADISIIMETSTSLIDEEFHVMMKKREIYIQEDIYREIIKTFLVKY